MVAKSCTTWDGSFKPVNSGIKTTYEIYELVQDFAIIRIIIKFKSNSVFYLSIFLERIWIQHWWFIQQAGMDQQLWNYHVFWGFRSIQVLRYHPRFWEGIKFWLIAINWFVHVPKKWYTPNLLLFFNRDTEDSPLFTNGFYFSGHPIFSGTFSVDVLSQDAMVEIWRRLLWMILSYCDVDTYSVICWDA